MPRKKNELSNLYVTPGNWLLYQQYDLTPGYVHRFRVTGLKNSRTYTGIELRPMPIKRK